MLWNVKVFVGWDSRNERLEINTTINVVFSVTVVNPEWDRTVGFADASSCVKVFVDQAPGDTNCCGKEWGENDIVESSHYNKKKEFAFLTGLVWM